MHLGELSRKSQGNTLSDMILGGQDGLVNVLGVILGVAAASGNMRIIIAGGLAATFAESISMAAVIILLSWNAKNARLSSCQTERKPKYARFMRLKVFRANCSTTLSNILFLMINAGLTR